MSYTISYCQKPEINGGDQDFTSHCHLFLVQIKPFEGLWTPNNKQTWPIYAYFSVEMFHKDCAI